MTHAQRIESELLRQAADLLEEMTCTYEQPTFGDEPAAVLARTIRKHLERNSEKP